MGAQSCDKTNRRHRASFSRSTSCVRSNLKLVKKTVRRHWRSKHTYNTSSQSIALNCTKRPLTILDDHGVKSIKWIDSSLLKYEGLEEPGFNTVLVTF